MAPKTIRRIFILEPSDYRIIVRTAKEKGLGPRGHSAAVRYILRDWAELRSRLSRMPFLLEGKKPKSDRDLPKTDQDLPKSDEAD